MDQRLCGMGVDNDTAARRQEMEGRTRECARFSKQLAVFSQKGPPFGDCPT